MVFNKASFRGAGLLLGFILLFSITNESKSQQFQDRVEISYNIQTWDPVHVKVEEKPGVTFTTIRFNAFNSTFYPFNLKLDFTIFQNLSPKPSPREIKVSHGLNNLFNLSVHVPGVGYGYQYTCAYWLTPSDDKIDEKYPYLIPLREGKKVNAKITLAGKINDSFTLNNGDTIYAMRRGLVTAVPRSETKDFRISGYDCLEVLHDDGTYMIYYHLAKVENFTSPGKIVLPGQPVGLVSDSSYLMISLLKVSKNKNHLEEQPITYTIGGNDVVTFDDLDGVKQSIHPWEVMIKELKGKELKKLEKK